MKTILEQVQHHALTKVSDLAGKCVLLRIDVNVSLGDNNTVDPGEDWRIIKALPTISYLVNAGARVVLLGHIGRNPDETLKPVFEYLSQTLTLGFMNWEDPQMMQDRIANMSHGSVLMIENVRQHSEEKDNMLGFLEPLIAVADCYVNDAFSVSHRKHASVHAITKVLPSYFGLQFINEVEHLSQIIENEEGQKITLLLGGAKFGTKLTLLEKFLPHINFALVGGALANVFLRERGFTIGASFADDSVDISHMVDNEKIILPIDCVDQEGDLISIDSVRDEDMILDIGHETEQLFESIIDASDIVLWNGPMGKYEDGYVSGSVAMADAIARSQSLSMTGGGDTATVILEQDLADSFNFISTGGGAMLDFLVDGTLLAIEVITEKEA